MISNDKTYISVGQAAQWLSGGRQHGTYDKWWHRLYRAMCDGVIDAVRLSVRGSGIRPVYLLPVRGLAIWARGAWGVELDAKGGQSDVQ